MKFIRILVLLTLVQLAAAQQPPPATVQGMVVQAGSGNALADVKVELRAVGGAATNDGLPTPWVVTGSDGRFSFSRVTPSTYRLIASSRGFANAEFGQTQPSGPTTTLSLAPGQHVENIRLTMASGAVISGRITDNGQPVGIADVYALKISDFNGRVMLVAGISAKTNDLGEYRMFWLPPGRYYVGVIIQDAATAGPLVLNPDGDDSASIQMARQVARAVLNRAIGAGAGDDQRHVITFYPSTTDPERATLIDLRAGAEAANINIDSPVQRVFHVRGRIAGIPQNSTGTPTIGLLTNRPNDVLENLNTPPDANGNFDIPRVATGTYTLTAAIGNVMGRVPVEVRDGDVNNVVVNLSRGNEVSGKIIVERQQPSSSPDPILSSLRVILRPEPYIWDPLGSPVNPDATFKVPASSTAPGVPPGGYRVLLAPILIPRTPAGQYVSPVPEALQSAYVKSIKIGAKDLLSSVLQIDDPLRDPIEIVVGVNPGSLEGRVLTEQKQPASSVWVALLPKGPLRYRTDHRYIATDVDGKFQFPNIGPGDYDIYAWENIEKLDWQEPRYMRPYETRGTAVHIEEGRKTTIEFTAIPAQ
jgi:hypothetical protein